MRGYYVQREQHLKDVADRDELNRRTGRRHHHVPFQPELSPHREEERDPNKSQRERQGQ